MILGLGVPEVIVIVVIVLLIFGPKNLPKIGKALGSTVKNVREGMEEGDDKKESSRVVKEVEDADVTVVESAPVHTEVPAATDAPATPAATPAASTDAKFCTECGTSNNAESKFCVSCGTKLQDKQAQH